METRVSRQRRKPQPCDPLSIERDVRQLLADKVSGNLAGIWLLVAEHLRLGTWDLLCGWSDPSIAPDLRDGQQSFQVTHPFHPLYQRKFRLVTYRFSWGEDRVYFHDEDGRLVSLPAAWTSAVPPDPFVVVADGRSAFRVQDLVELAALLRQLDEENSDGPGEGVSS